MKVILPLVLLIAGGCERRSDDDARPVEPMAMEAPKEARRSQPPAVVPKPADQAELDRLILAGFTPHADHLHRPGVKSCPLAQGGDAVM